MREAVRKRLRFRPSETVIGIVANWRPVKNIPLLFKAAQRLTRDFGNIRILVVGHPPDRRTRDALTCQHGLQGRVVFTGEQDDIIPFLSAMDIGVLCSDAESLSNSITEYMAAGLPCVVSDAGGNAEAIGYGSAGLVFKRNDSADFYRKLKKMIDNPDLRQKCSDNARVIAGRRYDIDACVQRYEALYKRLYQERYRAREQPGRRVR